MEVIKENISLIERYVNGRCGSRENRLIRQEMLVDTAFAERMSQYRILFSGLKALRIREIEQDLKQLEDEEEIEVADPELVAELELIERFCNGKLSKQELVIFQQRMKTDSAFAAKVEEYRLLFGGLRAARIQEIEGSIRAAQAEKQTSSTKESAPDSKIKETPILQLPETERKSVIRRLLPVFAVVAALLAAVILLPLFLVSDTDFDLALQEQFGEKPTIGTYMSGGSEELLPLDQAIELLRKGEYEAAEKMLIPMSSDSSALYLGAAKFLQNDYAGALQNYRIAQASENIEISNQADWFVVQSILEVGPIDKIQLEEALSKIINTEGVHDYQRNALVLQEAMESGWSKWRLKWNWLF